MISSAAVYSAARKRPLTPVLPRDLGPVVTYCEKMSRGLKGGMPELICEIWRDDDDESTSAEQVSEDHDRVRKAVSPNSTLLHTYTARSSFELFQRNYDWHGWGIWSPIPGVPEHFFTEEEAEEQRQYLATRIVT